MASISPAGGGMSRSFGRRGAPGRKVPRGSQDHAVDFRLDFGDVVGFPGGDPQAPALSHGVTFQAAMLTQDSALGIDKIAGRSGKAPSRP